MKVAFITTVYNVNKYLKQCLSSLEAIKSEKEVIVVDDRGTEDPYPIIKPFLDRNKNFKYVKNPKNIGLGFSRGVGVKNISKDVTHVYFMDSDDFLDPKKIDKFISTKLEVNKNFVMSSFYYHLKNKDVRWDYEGWFPKVEISKGNIKNSCIYVWGSFWVANTVKKTPFLSRSYEDTVWMADMLEKISDIVNFDETMHYYRRRKSSIVNSKQSVSDLNEMAAMIERESKFTKYVKLDQHISGRLTVFYEHYFKLKKSNRLKVKVPDVKTKINVNKVKIAILFQKLSFFSFWYTKMIEKKNFFE